MIGWPTDATEGHERHRNRRIAAKTGRPGALLKRRGGVAELAPMVEILRVAPDVDHALIEDEPPTVIDEQLIITVQHGAQQGSEWF
jgi:hypothetical protein